MNLYNTNLSEQSPRRSEALITDSVLAGDPIETQFYHHSCQNSTHRGFVMAYPLIMLERLWSQLSKIMTQLTLSAGNVFPAICPATQFATERCMSSGYPADDPVMEVMVIRRKGKPRNPTKYPSISGYNGRTDFKKQKEKLYVTIIKING